MGLFDKVKYYFFTIKENKRYKKIKSCNLPYPFWNKKRQTFEWVRYSKDYKCYCVEPSLVYFIGEVARTGVTYHYKAKLYGREFPTQTIKHRLMVNHCHSFEEVVKALYDYPETFSVPNEFLDEYSKQELDYLKKAKKYLQLIELKDIKPSKERELLDEKWNDVYTKKRKSIKDLLFLFNYQKRWRKIIFNEDLKRYSNENVQKYDFCRFMDLDNEKVANAIMDGEKNYKIDVKYSFSESFKNQKYLVSYDNNYLGIVEIVDEKVIKFKDLSEDMVNYKLAGFKSFKEYKNSMKKDFIEDGKIFNEEFTDESLICYETIKVIERFK
ncbi:MAG: hypothetical protein U0M92_06405 [Bacilli bacterium]